METIFVTFGNFLQLFDRSKTAILRADFDHIKTVKQCISGRFAVLIWSKSVRKIAVFEGSKSYQNANF